MKFFHLLPLVILGLFGCGIFLFGHLFEPERESNSVENNHASGAPTPIDFPQLDEARPLDLIDMKLDFPKSLKALDGRQVSLVGFMAPFDNLSDMSRCMIVPTYVGCTFCSPPSLTQVVFISQKKDGDDEKPFIEEASHISGILRLSLPGRQHDGKQQGFLYSIENAIITPYSKKALKRAPGHETPESHQQPGAPLASVTKEDLIEEVSKLLGRDIRTPIHIETSSPEAFDTLLRARLKQAFPEKNHTVRTKAFSLLGLPPGNGDWIETITEVERLQHIAIADPAGERIHLLNTVSENHPFVRLGLVGEIAIALTRQHSPNPPSFENDDSRRAFKALEDGIRSITINRYARALGISPNAQVPKQLYGQKEESELIPKPPDTLPQYLSDTGNNDQGNESDLNKSARPSSQFLSLIHI